MKTFISFFLLMLLTVGVQAQPLVTRSGYASFFSSTPLEDIKAENNQVQAAIDPVKKTLAFAMLMKGFLFDKDLMQEHFNENYVELKECYHEFFPDLKQYTLTMISNLTPP